jgi:SAM-dependent methyltransferase
MRTSLPEFDAVARDYEAQHAAATRLSGEETGYFARYKAADARALADAAGCSPSRILDFGSGIGNAVAPLGAEFPEARLTCLDVSPASLDLSRRRYGDDRADYVAYDGEVIPEEIGRFELIFTACVFHHIPHDRHVDLLGQLRRRLAPGGLLVLFEHNPWNPLTRHSVDKCPFDANAVLISAPAMKATALAAGFGRAQVRFRLFFPGPLAALRPLERWLTALPLGAQYSLAMQ